MRTRDIGRKVVADSAVDAVDLAKLLDEMESNFLTLMTEKPTVDSFFVIHTKKGDRYAVRYSKSTWRLQREEQAHGESAVEAHVEDEGSETNQGDLREQA